MNKQDILKMFQIKFTNIDKYKKYENDYYEIDGYHHKEFIRANKDLFKELISSDEKEKHDSYVTCIDSVRNEGLAPQKICVLKKNMYGEKSTISEILASRVLNYFGCPTSYNIGVYDPKEFAKYWVFSLDFISQDETFENIIRLINSSDNRIYAILPLLEDYLTKRYSNKSEKFKQDWEKLKYEFIKSHFVREFILYDGDLGTHNFGLLLNEKTKSFKLINFDYESTFSVQEYKNDHFNFEYMLRKQPEITKEVFEKSMTLKNALTESTRPYNEEEQVEGHVQRCVKNLLTNINIFESKYNEHCSKDDRVR